MKSAKIQEDRRDFLKKMFVGAGATILISNLGFVIKAAALDNGKIRVIVVDFNKCTGCRTCETVCGAWHDMKEIDGENIPGLGNPYYTNIRVHAYNPDVDIPSVCAMCPDNPCVEACPISPDPETGRKALYRDEETLVIKNDKERCIGCETCARACRDQRLGVIIPNPVTGMPERMCDHCGGDPKCVKYCPFDVLSYQEYDAEREFSGLAPDKIANELFKRFYNL